MPSLRVYDEAPAIKTLREAHCAAFSGVKRLRNFFKFSTALSMDFVEPSLISKAAQVSFGNSITASISKPEESR